MTTRREFLAQTASSGRGSAHGLRDSAPQSQCGGCRRGSRPRRLGVAIRRVADQAGLGFLPLAQEQYDFAVPKSRLQRPAVETAQRLLHDADVQQRLAELGLETRTK